ncbi:hypothetical protein BH11ACT6_BH11ACT6_35000 [soil metagenome]
MPKPKPDWADEDRQIDLLTKAVAYMPHPGKSEVDVPLPAGSHRPFAERLYRKGIRVFPNLAQVETVVVGEEQLGAYAPARTVGIDEAMLWNLLKSKDPALYQEIRDADTPEKVTAIVERIGPTAGHDIERVMSMLDQIRGTE